eukprot:2477376-Rhodomonas_salina.3
MHTGTCFSSSKKDSGVSEKLTCHPAAISVLYAETPAAMPVLYANSGRRYASTAWKRGSRDQDLEGLHEHEGLVVPYASSVPRSSQYIVGSTTWLIAVQRGRYNVAHHTLAQYRC